MTNKMDEHSHKIYDPEVSKQLMKHVGYYEHDINWVEEDVTLFSGVSNPFHFVKIKPHENVLDIGCGVGVDTLIASQYTDGLVYGLDPCENEVLLARELAKEKNLDPKKVKFCQSCIEDGLKAI
jgi:cyclopropane fatty-acyl-phospholipid synthase-like methyltransferase